MDRRCLGSTWIWICICALLLEGCAPGFLVAPTKTPTATRTLSPTSTLTPTPTATATSTPSPTFTPTPVPAVGTPVSNGRWQVTVLPGASNRNTLWQGFYYLYTKKGYAFVDMAVRIVDVSPGQNNTISTLQIKLVDQAGHSFLPFRLGFVSASGTGAIDPSTITLHLAVGDPIADHDVYIRIVTIVTSDSLKYPLKFEYEEIPAIPFSVE